MLQHDVVLGGWGWTFMVTKPSHLSLRKVQAKQSLL